jgi:hypothetical protein
LPSAETPGMKDLHAALAPPPPPPPHDEHEGSSTLAENQLLDHLDALFEKGRWLQPCGDLRLAGLSDGVSRP